jgi:hypothetical protein
MEKQKEKAGDGRDFIEERGVEGDVGIQLGLRMPLATASLSLGNMPRLALILPYQVGILTKTKADVVRKESLFARTRKLGKRIAYIVEMSL